jgi:hypothetical protein
MQVENSKGSPAGSFGPRRDSASSGRHSSYPLVRRLARIVWSRPLSPYGSTAQAQTSGGGAFVASPRPKPAVAGRSEVLLTPLVQAWADGRHTNHGLIVVPRFSGCRYSLFTPGGDTDRSGGVLVVRYAVRKD